MKKALAICSAWLVFWGPCLLASGNHSPVPPSASKAADRDLAEIVGAAAAGWQGYSRLIPRDDPAGYGFRSVDELAAVELGAPVEIHAFAYERFADSSAGDEALVAFTGHWRVPLLVGGEARAFVTVTEQGGRLTAVEFGAAGLAGELEKYRLGLASDQQLVLVRYYPQSADFVGIKRIHESVTSGIFYPLRSGRTCLRQAGALRQVGFGFHELVQSVRQLPPRGE